MPLSTQTKSILVISAILAIIYMIYNNYSSKRNYNDRVRNYEYMENVNDVQSNDPTFDELNEVPTESEYMFSQRTTSKNRASNGYKEANYSNGIRGNSDYDSFTNYFENGNELVLSGNSNNDQYNPSDEAANLAGYKSANSGRPTDEDIFKLDDFLPQESNKQWFDVMPEPTSVKNRHLINVARPIGVNTIGTTLKNPSYDIRGTPSCPKYVVSPFLNSSIEPDINIKGLC